MSNEKVKIAVFVSGGGTNLQALIDKQKSGVITSGEIKLVVSNNPNAFALERAAKAGIPSVVIPRKDYPDKTAYSMAIKEDASSIVFLRKVVKGPADGSYGVDVASLAGVPEPVIHRAREISDILEDKNMDEKIGSIGEPVMQTKDNGKGKKGKGADDGQLSLFASPEELSIAAELKNMDLDNMTPMKAMLYLQELKARLK